MPWPCSRPQHRAPPGHHPCLHSTTHAATHTQGSSIITGTNQRPHTPHTASTHSKPTRLCWQHTYGTACTSFCCLADQQADPVVGMCTASNQDCFPTLTWCCQLALLAQEVSRLAHWANNVKHLWGHTHQHRWQHPSAVCCSLLTHRDVAPSRKKHASTTPPHPQPHEAYTAGHAGDGGATQCNLRPSPYSTTTLPSHQTTVQNPMHPSLTCFVALFGAVSSMCWYASYRLGLMSAAMLPSTTMNSLLPLVFTPTPHNNSSTLLVTL